jgi:SpoIID/LytB domain protein
VSRTGTELDALIATEYQSVGHVTAMTATKRGVSGRIQTLAIKGDKGSVDVTGDLHIRRLLGGLRSSLFKIVPTKTGFEIHGAGFGHGVGMCQMGAIGMAEAGKDRDEILDHYYPGTHRHRLY